MKRSEMIELVAEALLSLYGYDANEWNEVRDATKMHRLKAAITAIRTIEKAGMLPPRRKEAVLLREEHTWDKEKWDNESN